MTTTTLTRNSWLLMALAIAQVAMTFLIQVAGGNNPGGTGARLLITPAPYAFAIWGVIYLLCLVHAFSVLRHGTAVADQPALTVPLCVLYAGAAGWSVVFWAGSSWGTFLVLAVMAAAAVRALLVVAGHPVRQGVPGWLVALERFTVGLYAGWVTVAVFINLASAIADHGLARADSAGWQLGVLIAALLAVAAVLWLGAGATGVAVAAIWGLVAVVVGAWGGSTPVVVTAAVGVVVAGAIWGLRRGRT